VVAAGQRRERLGGAQQLDGGARRGAQPQAGVRAGGRDEVEHVALDRRRGVEPPGRADEACDVGGVGHGGEVGERVGDLLALEHVELGGPVRVADAEPGHEPVALRLGERVRALHLHGVLGGDDEERARQGVGGAVDRGLRLLHALQQGRLRLGGRAVDLVPDDDVGEHRAGAELELVGLRAEDVDPGEVAGQQVRGELDPADRAVDAPRERLGERRLADAGDVLEQQVPLGEQHGDGQPHQLGAAGDHTLDPRADQAGGVDELVELGRGRHGLQHVFSLEDLCEA
jgi:hypothetical protein